METGFGCTSAQRAWCMGGMHGLLVVPSPALTLPACPPTLDNEGTGKTSCWCNHLGRLWCTTEVVNNLFMHSTSDLIQSLCGGGVCMTSIMFILNQGQLAYTSGTKLSASVHSRVESQMYQDGGKHIDQAHSDSQAITHWVCQHPPLPLSHDCPDAVMQCLNGIFALHEEVIQLGLIFQGVIKRVEFVSSHASPAFLCTGSQLLHQDFQPSLLWSA